jgi:hypothetical protein
MVIDQAARNVCLDWTAPFIESLAWGNLPDDLMKEQRLARHYKSFMIIGNILYKRSTLGILQRCIQQNEGQWLLREVHAGIYGHHAVPRTLVRKVFR